MGRIEKWFAALIYAGATVGLVWLFARFLLPWTAPLMIAFAAAAVMEAPVSALVKKGWKRSFASGVMTVTVLGLLIWLTVRLTYRAAGAATDFARQLPTLMEGLSRTMEFISEKTEQFAASSPDGMGEYIRTAASSIGASVSEIPALLSRRALDIIGRAAQRSPDTLLFTLTAAIGSFFISASFPKITAFIALQLPDSLKSKLSLLRQYLRGSFSGLVRAQMILMGITFFELTAAFMIMRVENAPVIAAVTAIIDALPVFGTGIVLIPWAVWCFLEGSIPRALSLLICYGIVNIVRSCIQAKLLGDQIGLDPVVSLLAVYAGWQVWGVGGMLLFPVLFVTLRQLNELGIIRLWKTV